jgi:hypothetical protein
MKDDAFNDELIIRYLLGDLPEHQQVEIEDRAFEDQQYLRRIESVESDLIDEYVRGELSDFERRRFESRFLQSAARRRKVEFARTLTNAVSEGAVTGKQSHPIGVRPPITWRASLTSLFRGLSPALRYSLAAAALVIVIGGSLLVTETLRLREQVARLQRDEQSHRQQEKSLEEQLAQQLNRSEDLAAQLQQEHEQRGRREELIRELEREREKLPGPPAQPAVASLALVSGIPRSGEERPRLVIPQSARLVRLRVILEPDDQYKSFQLELRAQSGRQIWSQGGLSARTTRAGQAVVLNLPANIFDGGEHELALKGMTDDGRIEDVGFYYFDVLKK